MTRPARFSHVVLQSYDMPRLYAWYQAAFDLDVLARSERAVIATYDDEHHRFAFTQLPGKTPVERPRSPLKHVAYAYTGLGDLVTQYRHMKALGHKPVECVNHGPTLSFYYEDPDGNGVEFFVDRFATMDEAKAFIGSAVFQKNLFGYLVDPEEVCRQFDRGVPSAEIMNYDQAKADAMLEQLKAHA
jgi:catechol-2,3-dioxygenase